MAGHGDPGTTTLAHCAPDRREPEPCGAFTDTDRDRLVQLLDSTPRSPASRFASRLGLTWDYLVRHADHPEWDSFDLRPRDEARPWLADARWATEQRSSSSVLTEDDDDFLWRIRLARKPPDGARIERLGQLVAKVRQAERAGIGL